MPVVYRLGDVYLLPSSRDTWGLGVNEAMASSRPIIVSNLVGCAPDLAENKRYARVFPSGRTHKLTHCLDELARNRAMLPELGVLARSEIQKWSVSAAADALLSAIAIPCRQGHAAHFLQKQEGYGDANAAADAVLNRQRS